MVARVLLNSGTGEETTDGDALLQEGSIVGTAGEGGLNGLELLGALEVVLVERLNGVAAGRAGEVVGASVTVKDAKVTAGDLDR